jgi:hypothetical protein
MTKLQSALLHYMSLPLAAFLVAYWWSLPETLDTSTSTEIFVSASHHSSLRGGDKVILTQQTGDQIWVPCGQIPDLCEELKAKSLRELRVWVTPKSMIHQPRVVAAVDGERVIVSAAKQNDALRSTKIASALVALAASIAAFILWYFKPLKPSVRRADAA